jgi:2-oxo-4-hydroxy-4-carboxy--5-ureidoimidazoline (OHCU) decarboxylase
MKKIKFKFPESIAVRTSTAEEVEEFGEPMLFAEEEPEDHAQKDEIITVAIYKLDRLVKVKGTVEIEELTLPVSHVATIRK